MLKERASGILLHITSLPSSYGIGDLGPAADKVVDFLAQAKQRYWQLLPINPTRDIYGNSPYSSHSAFAGNPLFISPELLVKDGFLSPKDLHAKPKFLPGCCEYNKVIAYKIKIFNQAYQTFAKHGLLSRQYHEFCLENSGWLADFALFEIIKSQYGGKVWNLWPPQARDREPKYLRKIEKDFKTDLEREKFFQYLFFRQWQQLKDYCHKKNIKLIGDIPIYVSYDSADVWANSSIFKLDEEKKPTHLSGVPPDYFSKTGQLWGNPVYRWEVLKESNYNWWIKRIAHNAKLFDLARIDHFRGLVGFWEVAAPAENAVKGCWQPVPCEDFFHTLLGKFPHFPIIAEDLGVITPDVQAIREHFKFPGMKVLLFAFGEDNPKHPYLPHNYEREFVVYTGTHDNNTTKGWFEKEASWREKLRLSKYLGRKITKENVNWELIRLGLSSVAKLAVFPAQDIIGLGEKARMNTPATTQGNWQWQLKPGELSLQLAHKLRALTEIYGRAF